MGISVADNFDHKSKKPLDARTSYSTLALMKAVVDANMNEGCLAYCAETDKYYKFLSTNTVDTDTGKWREFDSGSEYTAGDGIVIDENAEISTDNLQEGDMDDIVHDLPPVTPIDLDEIVDPVPAPSYAGFANPTGTIISFMGTIAPEGYLACDGSTKNIADYPRLANFFLAQFGSINKFGGDGTTTFKVPDLRGEFLRGTGTNGHSGEGNGASVGVHQAATNNPRYYGSTGNTIAYYGSDAVDAVNYDALVGSTTSGHKATASSYTSSAAYTHFKARPTNTSVLYCIKD